MTIRANEDPVARYLSDAEAVARSVDLDESVRAPVVAEFCRSALKAACHRVIWRQQLARGVPHADVERAIESAKRTMRVFALALFNDPGSG